METKIEREGCIFWFKIYPFILLIFSIYVSFSLLCLKLKLGSYVVNVVFLCHVFDFPVFHLFSLFQQSYYWIGR